MATPESDAFVRSFARGLKVIEAMGRGERRQTIASIAQTCDLPRTAVRRFLLTLAELGFVHGDGKLYWLTPKVLRLGMSYLYALPFWRNAQLVLEELSMSVGQSCALSVLDEEDIVYVARAHSRKILAMSPVLGSRFPAHAVSMGRVLLSGLDDAQLDAYLDRTQLTRLTNWTITDRQKLAEHIRRAGEQGYAWVDRELDESICGIAVPIRDAETGVTAAINVSLPAGPWTEETARDEFLVPLRQAAARIRSARK
ncbi:IclR family transcriptional regulator C-terminal domain-containing protein [Lacisediminimonas sp.]|uniref:IclR family transcriptional regulator domain-containing protein n=1 Tax=Lacisediminimonas sp. TaxID=3060582 RepID=UPI002728FF46|nr:IclR family transcriptional regulator C-terminal domain-containing protein [Lacisediminimonas sp.]MDO8298571.1 IclR family transcriptional regulator C-terminal domain-containing protein [Lacisediminimonas sp.]